MLCTITSCDRNFEENADIPKGIWNLEYKPVFTVDIPDTATRYNIYVNVRHTMYYQFSNLWIRITSQLPDSTTTERRESLMLADKEGKWFGDCLGDICDFQKPIEQNVSFRQPGKYTFQIEQIMRTESLPFVMSVGLRLEKVEKSK